MNSLKSKQSILWIVGIILIFTVVFYVGWPNLWSVLKQADPLMMFVLICLQSITMLLTAYLWHMLLEEYDACIPFWYLLLINQVASFVESVTPSVKIGGEAVKFYLLRKITYLSSERLVAIQAAQKYMSMMPFILISAPFIAFAILDYNLPSVVYAVFLFILVGGLLMYWKISQVEKSCENGSESKTKSSNSYVVSPWITRIKKCKRFLRQSFHNFSSLTVSVRGKGFSVSFFIWALYPAKVYIVTRMLEVDISIFSIVMATYVAYLVSMIPFSPGGLGSFETTMALMFSFAAVDFTQGFAIALLTRAVTFWFPLGTSSIATIAFILFDPSSKNTIKIGTVLPSLRHYFTF